MAASGLLINIPKTVVLVSQPAQVNEQRTMQGRWEECKIARRHKIVGIWYGQDMQTDDQYRDAVEKFHVRLVQLRMLNLSLAMRIVAANVFLISFFMYLNRFFLMPERIVNEISEAL